MITFLNLGYLDLLMTIRGKGRPKICFKCDLEFKTKIELRKHKLKEHSI